jgi:hypothetical protein
MNRNYQKKIIGPDVSLFVLISISWLLSASFFLEFVIKAQLCKLFEYFLSNFKIIWTELIINMSASFGKCLDSTSFPDLF